MRIEGDWLCAAPTQRVLSLLAEAGYQALVVGGCVRNALMGVPVTDVDVATDARPETVMALAAAGGLRAVPTGLVHGTITMVADGQGFEVTTFRRDVQSHGRHATVAFSTSLSEDAARRDFTMNALYARADGTVLDPLDGIEDLRARHVRFVGDPGARIREDYLRILRFFRFHAAYGDPEGGLDPDALDACARNAKEIAGLSAERIGAEMRKLLNVPDPGPALGAMAKAGVLEQVIPGADPRAVPVLVELEAGSAPDWLRRLVATGGSPTRLRLTRAEARAYDRLRAAVGTSQSAAELGYRMGASLGASAILARAALVEQPLPDGWENDLAQGAAARFPLRAHDLPHLKGPALGAELKRLEELWVASDFTATKDELLG